MGGGPPGAIGWAGTPGSASAPTPTIVTCLLFPSVSVIVPTIITGCPAISASLYALSKQTHSGGVE